MPIGAWLGQNNSGSAGGAVLSVTGWQVDNTDPANPVIMPAGIADVLAVNEVAAGLNIIDLNILQVTAVDGNVGVDLTVAANPGQSVILASGSGNGWTLTNADDATLVTALMEIADGGSNLFMQIDTAVPLVALGDLSDTNNGLKMVLNDNVDVWDVFDAVSTGSYYFGGVNASISPSLTTFKGCAVDLKNERYLFGDLHTNKSSIKVDVPADAIIMTAHSMVASLSHALSVFDISNGATPAFSVEGTPGISGSFTVLTGIATSITFTFKGGILVSAV
jgi:hypothetical protein